MVLTIVSNVLRFFCASGVSYETACSHLYKEFLGLNRVYQPCQIVGVYAGRLILLQASRLTQELTSGGQLLVEQYHRDVGRVLLSGGRQLGYSVNALLETFVPVLRIVQYKEVLDSRDWRAQGERMSRVRMLSRKGYAVDVHIRRGHP